MVDLHFRGQYGLITREQAVQSGLSLRQIRHRVHAGQWKEVEPGVYQHGAVPPTWESLLLGACLGTGALASHRSAAALWGLEVFNRPKVEITVPRPAQVRLYGRATVHQTTQWDRRDPTIRRAIPVTGIERTLLDCGAVSTLRAVERLAESAIRQRHTTWNDLLTVLMRHSRKGRDGCGTLRSLLEFRLGDRSIPLSDFSRLITNLLVDNGIERPELEYRVSDVQGGFIMQADLAWPDRKKIWELDGLAFHFGRTERERDNRKRNRAKTEGWNIQEILWSMYVDDPDALVTQARRFLS